MRISMGLAPLRSVVRLVTTADWVLQQVHLLSRGWSDIDVVFGRDGVIVVVVVVLMCPGCWRRGQYHVRMVLQGWKRIFLRAMPNRNE